MGVLVRFTRTLTLTLTLTRTQTLALTLTLTVTPNPNPNQDHPEQLDQIRQAAISSLHTERSDDGPPDATRNELAGERLSQTAVRRYLHENALYEDSFHEDSARSLQQSQHEPPRPSRLSSAQPSARRAERRARPSREAPPSGIAPCGAPCGASSTQASGRFLDRLLTPMLTPMGTLRSLRSTRGTARGTAHSLVSATGERSVPAASAEASKGVRRTLLDVLRPRRASCARTARAAARLSQPPPSVPPLSLSHMSSSTALLASELYAEPRLHTASALERHVQHHCTPRRLPTPRPLPTPRRRSPLPTPCRRRASEASQWAAVANGSSSSAQPPPPAPPPPPPQAPLSPERSLPGSSSPPEAPPPEPALSDAVVPESSSPKQPLSSPQRSSLRRAASPEHRASCATVHEGEVSPHADGAARWPPAPRLSAASSARNSEREPPELPEQLAADGLVLEPPSMSAEGRREEDAASLDAAMRRLEDRVLASIATTLGGRIDALAAELAGLRRQLPAGRVET